MSTTDDHDAPTPTTAEQAAVRKLIYRLAELDGDMVDPDTTPIVVAAGEALDNVAELTARVDTLEAQIETLRERAPDPSRLDYEQMDKHDKATVVRSKLRAEADATNGRAATTYKGVLRMFDGHPSAGHAYNLMAAAAEGDGYKVGESPEGQKRLTYRVNDDPARSGSE